MFKILRKKKSLGDHLYFWDFFFFLNYKKVTCRIYRFFFFLRDNDKRLELIYIYIYIFKNIFNNDKFQIWSVRFFDDKYKIHNLRDRRIWTNLWGQLFSNYLQLCHLKHFLHLENIFSVVFKISYWTKKIEYNFLKIVAKKYIQMWDPPFYKLQNKKLYLNTLTKQALRFIIKSKIEI